MKISAVRILELNERYNLIEGLSERELNNPEGTGFDLRVGEVHEIVGDSLLGITERHSSKTNLIGSVELNGNEKVILRPGQFCLVTTMETIHAPSEKIKYDDFFPEGYLIPKVHPRSSLQRGGVSFHATKTDPGYKGKLAFGIKNQGDQDFIFELGARMFNIEFEPVVGDLKRAYSGQHQGGRVTSDGETETQN
jgi:deoxycytidine triphosphate deaminase